MRSVTSTVPAALPRSSVTSSLPSGFTWTRYDSPSRSGFGEVSLTVLTLDDEQFVAVSLPLRHVCTACMSLPAVVASTTERASTPVTFSSNVTVYGVFTAVGLCGVATGPVVSTVQVRESLTGVAPGAERGGW